MERDRSIHFRLASVFGLGKAPVAPGTMATLVAGVPCFLIVGHFSWQIQLAFAGALFWAGCYISGKVELELGSTDPGEVVLDEVCGYLVAMTGHRLSFWSILIGFLLFRLFDIWKPWPIGQVERKLTGGASIMVDDVLAGVLANLLGFVALKLPGL